jgi:hypothetical protein
VLFVADPSQSWYQKDDAGRRRLRRIRAVRVEDPRRVPTLFPNLARGG